MAYLCIVKGKCDYNDELKVIFCNNEFDVSSIDGGELRLTWAHRGGYLLDIKWTFPP